MISQKPRVDCILSGDITRGRRTTLSLLCMVYKLVTCIFAFYHQKIISPAQKRLDSRDNKTQMVSCIILLYMLSVDEFTKVNCDITCEGITVYSNS